MWLPVLAIIYCLGFWVVAIRYPFVALLSIFALAPVTNTIPAGGLNLALADVNALLTIPALIMALRRSRFGLSLGPMTQPIYLYLGMCVLSSLVAFQGKDAVISVTQMLLYMVLVVLLFATLCPAEQSWKLFYYVVPIGTIWTLVGIYYKFSFYDTPKNAFGASIAATLLVTYDLWLAHGQRLKKNRKIQGLLLLCLLVMVAGLVLSVSRGAWIGTFLAIIWITCLRRSYKQLFTQVCAVIPLLVVVWFTMPPYLRDYALSVDVNRYNIRARYQSVDIAKNYFYSSPFLGEGVGLRKQYDATSLIWSTLAESGIIGAIFFLLIFYSFFRLSWRSRFVLPTSDPRFSLLTIGSALVVCKFTHGLVDNYWARGSITMSWAGFGLVLCYYRMSIVTRSQIIAQHWQRFKNRPQNRQVFEPVAAFGTHSGATNSTETLPTP